MKVSFWVPETENKENISKFISSELAEASNIKSKKTRKDAQLALMLLKLNFIRYGVGYCYFGDEQHLVAEKYEGNIKKYHCGKGYVKPQKPEAFK